MAKKVRSAKDYKTIMQIIEIEEGKYMIVGVVNRAQLDGLGEMFERYAREWRGQYQALAQAIVGAYERWKKGS